MTLEEIILELTSQTPSGGVCQLGDAFFKVWYCSDIWEWEYRGETFFDAQDLAEAIVCGSAAVPQMTHPLPSKTKAKGRASGSHAAVASSPYPTPPDPQVFRR
jgi:hypothetical protein